MTGPWRRGGFPTAWLAALAFALLGACANHPRAGGATRIQFWHSMAGEKGEALRRIIERFNRLPENVGRRRVEAQFIGSYEEGLAKLRTALMGGKGPHVAQVNEISTRLMIDSGVITPLEDFIRDDPGFPRAGLLPQVARYYEVGGKLYSLPFAASAPILYCNANLFAKTGIRSPPATWEGLETDARLLSSPRGVTGVTWPVYGWFFEEFLALEGVPLADHDNGRSARATRVNYSDPAGVGLLSLWARMAREGTFANVGRSWAAAEQSFLSGRSAMLITSSSDVFEILKEASFRVVTAPVPVERRPDAAAPGGVIIGGNSLWILNRRPLSEQRDAYRFIRYMASREVQKEWHQNTGYLPIRRDVIDDLRKEGFYLKYPADWTAIRQLMVSPDMPATRGALMGAFPEAREQEASAIEEAISGQSDAGTALRRAAAETEQSLRRYNRGKE